MLEEYRVANSRRSCFDDVHVETAVVLHGRADVEAHFTVIVPRPPVFGFHVRHD